MPIETKLEKADDVIEQFWTGKGMNVKAGQKLTSHDIAWHTLTGKDTTFRDMLYRKLKEEGYFRSGIISQLEDASLVSVCAAKDVHELDFRMQYIGQTKYGDMARFNQGMGAEFNRNADGTHNLKIFPKARTADGRKMRIVYSQDAEWRQDPKLAKELLKDFQLMYGILQEMGYLSKEE